MEWSPRLAGETAGEKVTPYKPRLPEVASENVSGWHVPCPSPRAHRPPWARPLTGSETKRAAPPEAPPPRSPAARDVASARVDLHHVRQQLHRLGLRARE